MRSFVSLLASQDWLSIWHNYRTSLILLTFFALLAFRIILKARESRDKVPQSPPLSSVALHQPVKPFPETTSLELKPNGNEKAWDSTSKATLKPSARKGSPRRIVGHKLVPGQSLPKGNESPQKYKAQVLVFFSSVTGATEKTANDFAKHFAVDLKDSKSVDVLEPELHDLSYVDYDEYFISAPKSSDPTLNVKYFYIFLLPTYNIDTILNTFLEHLQETHHDFRIDTAPLTPLLGYSVFGFGDKLGWPTEQEGFCSQAREVDKWMAKLTGRKRAYPLGMGDVRSDAIEQLAEWRRGVARVILDVVKNGSLGDGVKGSGDPLESDEEEEEEVEAEDEEEVRAPIRPKKRRKGDSKGISDLEDLGRTTGGQSSPLNDVQDSGVLSVDFTTYGKRTDQNKPAEASKEMVPKSSPTYASLTKQGYTIVGSHSGVKICRWTKSALRGRGSCYKFSFYGIKSHLCMEATPSLSCSNKCVFCWRHGTNPVGTTWRWKVDPPDMIFEGIKEGHYKKIRMMRGVPGVRAERFSEAFRIKHCALSLVGEPIFYPHINELLSMLHKERISSFLVCNAQHPDQLAALDHVTQLYVSIDASNRESLRKIDRPLHRDFWERFQRCLDILKEKRFQQRTVFRLTLVKGFNIDDEVEGYAKLVEQGLPCFVEVKGVTYCGTSSSAGAGLTMQNVPFYAEVTEFVLALNKALNKRGLGYGIAAEHAHSCCVLLASNRFFKEGKWHTIIDYGKFFKCLESGEEFGPEDYVGSPTPEWANWGSGGFDPADERVYHRKGKGKPKELTESPSVES
ncbi:MAG: hypothetical protein M4579_001303 [Chaenotheca gracillima]|nr:MAG: hypothetical protein M4579_001303 [Chaenotheca gracillima]